MKSQDIDCSIVIVTWNLWGVLKTCLESVHGETTVSQKSTEIIVVDNGSTDGTQEEIGRHFPDVQLITMETNVGLVRATNRGIAQARGRYVFLLNNDTIVLQGALDRLIDAADDHSDGGVFAAHELGSDGRSHLYVYHRNYAPSWRELISQEVIPPEFYRGLMRRVRRRTWHREAATKPVVECGRTASSCILVRRAAIEDVGLLDDRFFYLFDDSDWCYRFRQKGWRIFIVPQARVVHLVGKSSTVEKRFLLSTRAKLVWYRKYFQPRLLPIYRTLIVLGGIPRLVYYLMRLVRERHQARFVPLVREWWQIVANE